MGDMRDEKIIIPLRDGRACVELHIMAGLSDLHVLWVNVEVGEGDAFWSAFLKVQEPRKYVRVRDLDCTHEGDLFSGMTEMIAKRGEWFASVVSAYDTYDREAGWIKADSPDEFAEKHFGLLGSQASPEYDLPF